MSLEISSGIAGTIAAAIAVPLVMGLLQKFKSTSFSPPPDIDFDDLKKKYQKWEIWEIILLVILTASLTYI